MKLLLISDAVGGVWVYSLELARALRPLGIETIIAILGPTPSASQRRDASGLRLIDTGLPLDWTTTDPRSLRHAGEAIAGLAEREGADVVQTCSAALLADTDFGRPCIAVQHSCVATWWSAVKDTSLPADFLWRRELIQRGLGRAAAVIAPTAAYAADIERTYPASKPVAVVHNGRRPAPLPSLPRGDFVLTASRLWDEGKNVATLDNAATRIAVPFQAAGAQQGPNGEFARLDNLELVGEVSSARMAALLSVQPIFASAALYEPFGLSVLEAASAGCALVLSDIPTHRELWGDAAIYVRPRDANGFASAIARLIDEPAERDAAGRRARERAQLYSPERMAFAMRETYLQVTAAPAAERVMALAGAA